MILLRREERGEDTQEQREAHMQSGSQGMPCRPRALTCQRLLGAGDSLERLLL